MRFDYHDEELKLFIVQRDSLCGLAPTKRSFSLVVATNH